ncbi:MAG TPA: twin-arginine translocation signal domain-containing protein, partial [Planctomycetaceae bacterium]|nr:twin-arginine translocation signal domain-containing protein [Planctomycetaceae bacterium]
MQAISRRNFLQGAAVAGSSLLLTGTRASGRVIGANDRLRIAVAGVNGRGRSHIDGWLKQDNVEIVYLID